MLTTEIDVLDVGDWALPHDAVVLAGGRELRAVKLWQTAPCAQTVFKVGQVRRVGVGVRHRLTQLLYVAVLKPRVHMLRDEPGVGRAIGADTIP